MGGFLVNRRVALVMGLIFLVAAASAPADGGTDWPQYQYDAQHTGRSPEVLLPSTEEYLAALPAKQQKAPMVVGWKTNFLEFDPPEHIYRTVQIVGYGNRLYVPTMEGSLFALDPATGKTLWRFHCGEPVMHTAAAAAGRVFFATMRGSVFAVDAATGQQVWRWNNGRRTGFSGAVLLADGMVFAGGRGGDFNAISQAEGKTVWTHDVGAPIYQTPAWNEGRVYVGAEDMHAYCWDASRGTLLWKSRKLAGMSFRDYSPLVYAGTVILESQPNWAQREFQAGFFPFVFRGDELNPWVEKYEESLKTGTPAPAALEDMRLGQDRMVEELRATPFKMTRFVLDELTGEDKAILPCWLVSMSGTQPPPIVDRDGMLVTGIGFWSMYSWGRMNPKTWRIEDILWAGADGGGHGNADEAHVLSAAGDLIFAVHWYENSNCGRAEYFDLNTRKWTTLPHGLEGAFGYQEAQCGTNPSSIAFGAVYHQAYSLVHNWVPAHVKYGAGD